MEQKTKGGKRNGSGRKPIGNLKKKQITIFVEGVIIWKFGNEEKLKEQVYKFLKEYGEVKVTPTPANVFDAAINNDTQDEFKIPASNSLPASERFYLEAKEAKSKSDLENVLKKAKKELGYFPYQKLADAIKPLFDNFFND